MTSKTGAFLERGSICLCNTISADFSTPWVQAKHMKHLRILEVKAGRLLYTVIAREMIYPAHIQQLTLKTNVSNPRIGDPIQT